MNDMEKQLEIFHKIDELHNEALTECFKGIMLNVANQVQIFMLICIKKIDTSFIQTTTIKAV